MYSQGILIDNLEDISYFFLNFGFFAFQAVLAWNNIMFCEVLEIVNENMYLLEGRSLLQLILARLRNILKQTNFYVST